MSLSLGMALAFTLNLSFLVYAGENEGIYRISLRGQEAMSSGIISHKDIVILVPQDKKLTLHRPDEDASFIAGSQHKQKYIKFKASGKKAPGGEFAIRSVMITSNVIERIKSSLTIKDKSEVISLLNSQDEEGWKKLLFGEKSINKLRFSGLLELKRRWQDVNEHLEITLNEDYGSSSFEDRYFIPTGFIDIGNGEFLRAEELIDNSVQIDVKNAKVKLLKGVISYHVSEILHSSASLNDSDLNDVLAILHCSQSCLLNSNTELGHLLSNMIEVLQTNISEHERLLTLKEGFISFCGPMKIKTSISHQNAKKFNSLALYYPHISIDDYVSLSGSNLSPESAILFIQKAGPKRPFSVIEAREFQVAFSEHIGHAVDSGLSLEDGVPFYLEELEKNGFKGPSANVISAMMTRPEIWTKELLRNLGDLIRQNQKEIKSKNLRIEDIYRHYYGLQILQGMNSQKLIEREMNVFLKQEKNR